MRILIVEDNDDFRLALCKQLLIKVDAKVTEAKSGNSAIELLKENSSFDLIISDHDMPNGSGIDILNFINDSKMHIPFIFFTGSQRISTELKPFKLIEKPRFNDLIAVIKSLCS